MGWLSLTIAGLFIPHGARRSVGGRSLGRAGTCLTLDAAAVPARYSGVCAWSEYLDEIPAWRIAQEAWAGVLGVNLPDYRTRREFEHAKAKCLEAIAICEKLRIEQLPTVDGMGSVAVEFQSEIAPEPAAEPISPHEFQLAPDGPRLLKPRDAAETFLADLWELGETGPHSDARMSQLYAEHCARYDLMPTPENVMRAQLKKMPGIWKQREDKAKSVTGLKRERKYVWMVSPAAADARVAA